MADSKKTSTAHMFHQLAVCTAVLVAVLSNDAFAFKHGTFLTSTPGGDHEDTYSTGKTPSVTPVATTPPATEAMPPTSPTDRNEGSHANDCDPHFPREKTEAPPIATTLVTEPSTVTLTPITSSDLSKSASKADSDETTTNIEQTALQANTQSGDQNDGNSTGFVGFMVAGAVAAVAAVGAVASQVKKAREADTDDALVTPGENENIHIEIKRTPAGGSTIL